MFFGEKKIKKSVQVSVESMWNDVQAFIILDIGFGTSDRYSDLIFNNLKKKLFSLSIIYLKMFFRKHCVRSLQRKKIGFYFTILVIRYLFKYHQLGNLSFLRLTVF